MWKDIPLDNSKPSIRILMLHGFTQSGHIFDIKTRPLARRLTKTLVNYFQTDEEYIEFVYADAPFDLNEHHRTHTTVDGDAESVENLGWWRNLDITEQYDGLETSLSLLASLVQTHGPFTGVIGFSQGATLAAMFASWCEIDVTPGRREALQRMCKKHATPDLAQILSTSPQRPLQFSVLFSGWRGTMEYYHGFYEPVLLTPTVHVLGTLDTMIPRWGTIQLFEACPKSLLIEHCGVHFVPRNDREVEKVANGVAEVLTVPWLSSPVSQHGINLDETYLEQHRGRTMTSPSPSETGTSTPVSQSSQGSRFSSRSRSSFRGFKIVRKYRLANTLQRY